MRKASVIISAILLSLGASAAPALAQSYGRDQQVDSRLENQQDRIAQGVRSGALTPGEAARLERREGRLHRLEARQEYHNGGDRLTARQQRRDNRLANRDSRAIYRLEHNGRHYRY